MAITLHAPDRPPPPSARPPLVGLSPAEVAALHDELLAYHRAFAPLFQRAEQRHWARKYLERPRVHEVSDVADIVRLLRPAAEQRNRAMERVQIPLTLF